MALVATYTYEDGSDNQAVVTGLVGVTDVTGPAVYSSAAAVHGTRGLQLGPAWAYVQYSIPSVMTASIYFRRGSETPTSRIQCIGLKGNASVGSIGLKKTGEMLLMDGDANIMKTGTHVSAPGETMRIDWQATSTSSTLDVEARFFYGTNIEGTTADETLTMSVATTEVMTATQLNTYSSTTLMYDCLRIWDDTTTWPAPYVDPPATPAGSAYRCSGSPSLDAATAGSVDHTLLVPSGVQPTDTVLLFVAGSVGTPSSVTASSPNGTFSDLVPIRTDKNMFSCMISGTGVTAGDVISVDLEDNSLSLVSHHYFTRGVARVGTIASETSDTTTLVAPSVATSGTEQVFVFETDRTISAPIVTAATNSNGATVSPLSDTRYYGISESSVTATHLAQVASTASSSGTTTVTLSQPTHNDAIFHVVIEGEPVGSPQFVASASGTATGSPLTGTVPAGVTKNHFGVLLFTDFGQAPTLTPSSISWDELDAPPSKYVFQTATMIVFSTLGKLKAGDAFTISFDESGASGAWVAAWYESAGIDSIGTYFDRNGTSSAETDFPSLTTTSANQTVLCLAGEKSTRGAMPGGVVTSIASTSSGLSTDAFLDGDFDSGTTSSFIGSFVQGTAGATPQQSVTYSNDSTRGAGFQLSLLAPTTPQPSGSATVSYWDGSQEQAATITYWDGSQEQAVASLTTWESTSPSETGTLADLEAGTSSQPFYVAHRGGSKDWPEMTKYAYDQATSKFHIPAIEVSVQRSSDGVFVCSHDANTSRVTGQSYDIASTPWSTLSTLMVSSADTVNPAQPSRAFTKLSDVLDAYAHNHLIFIEDKTYANNSDLLDVMDSYPDSTQHFVWKLSGGVGNTPITNATSRGYKTWGYFFTGTGMETYTTDGPRFDYVGIDMNCTDEELTQAASINVPMVGHILSDPAKQTRLLDAGCIGIMVAELNAIIPENYYP